MLLQVTLSLHILYQFVGFTPLPTTVNFTYSISTLLQKAHLWGILSRSFPMSCLFPFFGCCLIMWWCLSASFSRTPVDYMCLENRHLSIPRYLAYVELLTCGLLLLHYIHLPSYDFHEGKGLIQFLLLQWEAVLTSQQKLIEASYVEEDLREFKLNNES